MFSKTSTTSLSLGASELFVVIAQLYLFGTGLALVHAANDPSTTFDNPNALARGIVGIVSSVILLPLNALCERQWRRQRSNAVYSVAEWVFYTYFAYAVVTAAMLLLFWVRSHRDSEVAHQDYGGLAIPIVDMLCVFVLMIDGILKVLFWRVGGMVEDEGPSDEESATTATTGTPTTDADGHQGNATGQPGEPVRTGRPGKSAKFMNRKDNAQSEQSSGVYPLRRTQAEIAAGNPGSLPTVQPTRSGDALVPVVKSHENHSSMPSEAVKPGRPEKAAESTNCQNNTKSEVSLGAYPVRRTQAEIASRNPGSLPADLPTRSGAASEKAQEKQAPLLSEPQHRPSPSADLLVEVDPARLTAHSTPSNRAQPLNDSWFPVTDAGGIVRFYNSRTGEFLPLPANFTAAVDPASGKTYFLNHEEHSTSYQFPAVQARLRMHTSPSSPAEDKSKTTEQSPR